MRGERKAAAAKKQAAMQNISKGDASRANATHAAEPPFPGRLTGRKDGDVLTVIDVALGTTTIPVDNMDSESEMGAAHRGDTPSKVIYDTTALKHVSELEGTASDTQCVLHPLVYSTITEDDDLDRQVRDDSAVERYLEVYTEKQNHHR